MTIEIHHPELEAYLQQQMKTGAFRNLDEVLLQALQSLPATHQEKTATDGPKKNFADFLFNSPLPGSGLLLEKAKDKPRPIEL